MRSRLRSALADREDVVAAYLFGSHATGDTWAGSDVDLGLLFEEEPSDALAPQLVAEQLEEACDLPAGTLDVRVLNGASPRFLHQVLKHGDVVHEADADRRIAFETKALSRYYDLLPLLRVQDEAQRERFRGQA